MSNPIQERESEAHHLFETGTSCYDAENFSEAENLLNKALKLYRTLEKKNSTYVFNVASTLYNLGCIFHETGRRERAESFYLKALKKFRTLAEKSPDLYSPYLAMTLYALGILSWQKKEFEKAEPLYCEAREKYRALAQKDPEYASHLGDVLNNLGGLYFGTGNFREAEEAYEEALLIYEKRAQKDSTYIPDLAMILNNLGVILHNTGDFHHAEEMYEKALNLCRDFAQKDPNYILLVAAALNNLGLFYWKTETFIKAEKSYKEALNFYKSLAEKNPQYIPDIAMTLGNLGLLYSTLGDFNNAEESYEEALHLYKELSQENPIYIFNVAGILNNLGSLYSSTRKFEKAEKMCREALAIYQKLSKKDPHAYDSFVAMALKNLGDVLDAAENLPEAEEAYREALNRYKALAQTSPAYDSHEAMILVCIGNLYRDMGRLQKAEEALTEALNRYKALAQTSPAYRGDVATTLEGLGAFYLSTRNFSETEKAFTEALHIERDLAQENPEVYTVRVGSALSSLGILYADMGKVTSAEEIYHEALEIKLHLAQKNPDIYEPDLATTLNNIGALYWDTNNFEKAEKNFMEALEIKRHLAQKNPDIYESDLAVTINNLGNLYWKTGDLKRAEEMYRKALAIREKRALWFDMAESYSGLSLIFHEKTIEALKLLEMAILFSGEKKYAYAQKGKREEIYLNVLEYIDDPKKAFGILEALRDDDILSMKWELREDELRDKNQRRTVRKVLKREVPFLDAPFEVPDDVFILYIQYMEDHVLYVGLTKEGVTRFRGTPSFVTMGNRLLRNLHIQVYARTRGSPVDKMVADFEKCSVTWGLQLPWEVQNLISEKEYLVLSPDSVCSSFPLEGLCICDEPLCLSKTVMRTTSAHLLKEGAFPKLTFDSALVVGNPWPPCGEKALSYLSPSLGKPGLTDLGPITSLGDAEEEAGTLARILPHARLLVNTQATADAVLRELPSHPIIHIAGHGSFGRVLLFSGPMREAASEFEPEEFSMLRKAWRSLNGKTVYMMDEWDLITDVDIRDVPLRRGALVFLNACGTGKHAYGGGGHFQGLAQAFLKSGASHVISSLIPLFDEPSMDFAVSFYDGLRSQQSVVKALRDTRKRMRKKYESQLHWIPYVDYGSPLLHL